MRNTAVAVFLGLALMALAGCVTAHIDYPLSGVRSAGWGRFHGMAVALVLKDGRYSGKNTVGSYAHRKGTYNQGLEFPTKLDDYAEVFGQQRASRVQSRDGEETLWYTAPDRLYWKPAGPIDDLKGRLAEHLRKAGVFARVEERTASGQQQGGTLEVALKRFVSLKERRPGIDTFGFLGISALASSREVVSVMADWRLLDGAGKELDSGVIEFTDDGEGSCWRAKNKPFALNNKAARALGDALVNALK